MKKLMAILAVLGLGLTAIPSLLVFIGDITPDLNKKLMTAGAIIWFATAPVWFRNAKRV